MKDLEEPLNVSSYEESEKVAALSVPNTEREDAILGGKRPLPTILRLSFGPFVSQFTNSLYGMVNTLWLKNAVSELATTALSTSTTIDSLSISFGYFFQTCSLTKTAMLFGEHRSDVASQVLSDLLRLCVIVAIIIPATLIPVGRPFLRWIGANKEVEDMAFSYLMPIMSCAFFPCLYLLLCGCLQGEGRTVVFAVAQGSSFILNACVFNPAFLLGAKIGMPGSAISIILSQAIPAIILLILFYMGKFTIKPKFSQLFKKPCIETWQALKTGFSSLVSSLSATLPSIFFQKFIGNSCATVEEFNIMMSMYNAYNKIYQIVVAIFLAVCSGYLPAASYAFAAGRKRRVLHLFGHMAWMVSSVAIILEIFLFSMPRKFSSIFSSQEFFHERFKDCMPRYWLTCLLCSWQYIGTCLLQSTNRPIAAFITSFFTQLLFWPMFSFIFYYTDKHNVVRLFNAVFSNDTLSFIIYVPFIIQSVYRLVQDAKAEPKTGDGIIEEEEEEKEEHPRFEESGHAISEL